MDLEKRYEEAYESLLHVGRERREKSQYTAMGYTSNLDLLCEFDVKRLNQLLQEYMTNRTLSDMKTVSVIRNVEELLSTIVYYCTRGIGGEADVLDMEIVKRCFRYKKGMGGTAVQAALAIAEIGCDSIVHLTDDSKDVCEILESPYVYTVSQGEELIHTEGVEQTQEQEVHCIVQFKKGDIICLGEEMIEIPCSNRLILTKITVNEFVPLSKPYLNWIEKNADYVRSNVLSSLNAILDPMILKQRLEVVKTHVEKYRANNTEGIVFFEDAHYHDYEIRKLCLETVYSCVDIVSLNEEELKYTLEEMCDFPVDINNIAACVEGAKSIRKKFGI